MKRNRFEEQVEELFKGYNVTQYRENPTKNKNTVPWVEFWISSDETSLNLKLSKLDRLYKLFNTKDITLTGGDLACPFAGDFSDPAIYVIAENVVFGKSKGK